MRVSPVTTAAATLVGTTVTSALGAGEEAWVKLTGHAVETCKPRIWLVFLASPMPTTKKEHIGNQEAINAPAETQK